jgi:FKBP-type peptidyl-prolyl cis-trans isomerase
MLVSALVATALLFVANPEPQAPIAATETIQVTDKVIGKGQVAGKEDVVTLNYSLKLKDGEKVIDSNAGGAPFAFRMGSKSVIPGFEEGILGMKPGGSRIVVIPPSKGYGEKGAGAAIPGNSTLVFEIELLRVDAKNKKSKLEITTLKSSQDAKIVNGDTVAFHYTGTFLNGKKFDSSRDRNEPLTTVMGQGGLIPGFIKTLEGMRLNEIRRVVIPYDQAYGERGAGETIPPFSTLVFEIEVVKITK